MARQDCAVNVGPNRRGRGMCSGVFGLLCDRSTASFCAFSVVPNSGSQRNVAPEDFAQEDFVAKKPVLADLSERPMRRSRSASQFRSGRRHSGLKGASAKEARL